jgi:hypothetical protein
MPEADRSRGITNAIAAGGVVQSSGHIQNFDNQARRMDHYFDLVSIGIMT